MDIRSTVAGDFDAIAALTNHFIQSTAIHFNYAPVTAAELRASWEAGCDRYPCLSLIDGAELLGFAKATAWRTRDAYRFTAEVSIYLQPQRSGRGYGRRLYGALIDACRAAGFHSLIGGIALPNAASVALHKTLGFREVGAFREVGWKFDRWHDVVFYQRVLDEPA